MTPDITVADLNVMMGMGGAFQAHARRCHIALRGSYADFVGQLYQDLDRCFNSMRTMVHLLQDDGEDRLTADVVLQLDKLGYDTSHDPQSGGHVDIGVKAGPHSWIGEAKLDWSIDEGMKQLTTRYVALSGDPKHDDGGLLFYLRRAPDCKASMDAWRAQLEAQAVPCTPCPNNPLAFFSEVKSPGTGLPFHVRSIGISLYFQPQDKSGVATRVRRAARSTKKK